MRAFVKLVALCFVFQTRHAWSDELAAVSSLHGALKLSTK